MKRTALYVRPHGQDGSRPSFFLFAGTLACVLKGGGWVSAVSVLSFGFETLSFGLFVAFAHGLMKWTALLQ